jgi:uncharacterized spore protein YtfJ
MDEMFIQTSQGFLSLAHIVRVEMQKCTWGMGGSVRPQAVVTMTGPEVVFLYDEEAEAFLDAFVNLIPDYVSVVPQGEGKDGQRQRTR